MPTKRLDYGLALTAFIVLLIFFAGCGKKDTSTRQMPSANTAKESSSTWAADGWLFPSGWQPIDEESECVNWAKALEQSVAERDILAAEKLVDFSPLTERTVANLPDKKFGQGFKRGIDASNKALIQKLAEDGTEYTFVGIKETEFNEPGALFRLMRSDGAVNYHLWCVQADERGEAIGVDVYVYLAGERLSNTFRRLALIAMPKDDRTLLEKLAGTERKWAANTNAASDFLAARQSGNHQGVVRIFNELPNEMKQEKAFALVNIMSAMELDEATYVKAIEYYQQQFPDDPSADLLRLDLHLVKGEFTQFHEVMDRVEKSIISDAHTATLRAAAFLEEDQLTEAMEYSKKAIQVEPNYETGYWMKVTTALALEKHDTLRDTFIQLADKFGYVDFQFDSDPDYAEFMKSPEYQDLMKHLAGEN